jgi:CPA2 family monovalent cation:H+ antiporter-2
MAPEDVTIMQIALAAFVALAGGIVFHKMKQPSILAYVLTGVIVGPSFLGLIQSREQVGLFAELGVLLLLFVLGMELNVKTFKQHLFLSSMCVILMILFGLTASFFLSLFFDWPFFFTVALGFVAALSSTAVVVNVLEGMNLTSSSISKIIIGILIAQDIAVIPMILTLQALTSGVYDWNLFAKIVFSLGFMAVFIAYLTNRSPSTFSSKRVLGANRDLYMLASLSICFAAAALAAGLGVTAPYGAFLAGLAIGNISSNNNLFVESIRPIQKLLLMVFFVSIGILLDIRFVMKHIVLISSILVMVTIVKTVLNIFILRILKVGMAPASFIGISLAQLGEFAFLLTTILDRQDSESFDFAQHCLIAITVLSLAFSPIWLKLGRRIHRLLKRPDTLSSKTMMRYTVWYAVRRFRESVVMTQHGRFSLLMRLKARKLGAAISIKKKEKLQCGKLLSQPLEVSSNLVRSLPLEFPKVVEEPATSEKKQKTEASEETEQSSE